MDEDQNTQEPVVALMMLSAFFSMMSDSIGRNFTTKEIKYGFRKISVEFSKRFKRLDPGLPCFYYTSSHSC